MNTSEDTRKLDSTGEGRAYAGAWLVSLLWAVSSAPLFVWIAFNSPIPMYILRKLGTEYGRTVIVLHDMALHLAIAVPFALLVSKLAVRRFPPIVLVCSGLTLIWYYEGLVVADWQTTVTLFGAMLSLPICTIVARSLGKRR